MVAYVSGVDASKFFDDGSGVEYKQLNIGIYESRWSDKLAEVRN